MLPVIMPAFIGAICIVLGILNMKGNVASLHLYHRHRVSEEDRLTFGKWVGLGTVIIGCAAVVFGALSGVAYHTGNGVFETVGSGVLAVAVIVGLGMNFYAMIKYNKGIF